MHNFKIKTKNINHITTLYFNLDSFLLFLLIIINYRYFDIMTIKNNGIYKEEEEGTNERKMRHTL